MGLDQLTVMVITFNEEANIGRTLASLRWAPNVLVIDSYSTDGTLDIVSDYPNARVIQRQFHDFADQCNRGLDEVRTPWVLSIDADYVFPDGSAQAVQTAMRGDAAAWRAEFRYCIHGKPVRGSILPPRTVLYKKAHAIYRNDGHGHRVVVDGPVRTLPFRIHHDDRLPLLRDAAHAHVGAPVEEWMKVLFRERSWGEMAMSETYAHLEHLRVADEADVHRDHDGLLHYRLHSAGSSPPVGGPNPG